MTELCHMLIVSCALIYDDAIRVCAVSTATADRTGKFVLLTYSLTASHCSAEAHLAGVPFPRSFDSRLESLVWCGCKKIHRFRILKAFLVKKKGTKTAVLSRVAKGVAKFRSVAPRAWDVCTENFSQCSTVTPTIPIVLYACLVPSGRPYIEFWMIREFERECTCWL